MQGVPSGTENSARTFEYRKDPEVEKQLRILNADLAALESEFITSFEKPTLPLLFIVGPPRSGTTLLSQVLASTGGFSYINNFVARFWMAPYLGMRIEKALGIRGDCKGQTFTSKIGVTESWAGPHEFGYFWGRWFRYGKVHKLSTRQLKQIDSHTLAKEIAALESVYDLPMFFKNLGCGLQVGFLADLFPNALFLVCNRNPIFNMQSLLIAREKVFGDRSKWFSLRPKEYQFLKTLSPYEQVAGQVYYTLKDIEESIYGHLRDRVLEIGYEELCKDPRKVVKSVARFVSNFGCSLRVDLDAVPESFKCQNTERLPQKEFEALKKAKEKIFGV